MPHIRQKFKDLDSEKLIKVRLTGVLAPVYGAFAFFDFGQWSKGADLNCSIIMQVLIRLARLGAPFGPHHTLNIQADNASENKNFYMIVLLCYLVECGCFGEINLNFLMVGHTHEDIDQMFSRFSMELRKKDALTLDEMMEVLSNSFNYDKCGSHDPERRKPQMIKLEECYDIKNWLKNDATNLRLNGISQYHLFRITVSMSFAVKFFVIKNFRMDHSMFLYLSTCIWPSCPLFLVLSSN